MQQDRLKMQQILAAIGSRSEQTETDDMACDPYDWYQVRYFSDSQLKAVENLCEHMAGTLSQALKRAFRQDVAVELTQIRQSTMAQYKNAEETNHAYMPFLIQAHQSFGGLAVPASTMKYWLDHLLGASESEADKPLSPLEATLLSDISISVINAVSSCLSFDIEGRSPLTKGHFNVPLDNTEEIAVLNFVYKSMEQSDDPGRTVTILIPCAILTHSLEGIAQTVRPSDNVLQQAIRHHIDQVPMLVTAEFTTTTLTLEQAMGLAPGDVLLLEKDLDDPVTLKIEDRIIFRCKPVQCENNYAVMVTQIA